MASSCPVHCFRRGVRSGCMFRSESTELCRSPRGSGTHSCPGSSAAASPAGSSASLPETHRPSCLPFAECRAQKAFMSSLPLPLQTETFILWPAFLAHIGWKAARHCEALHWMQEPCLSLHTAHGRPRRLFEMPGSPSTGSMRSRLALSTYVSGVHCEQNRWTHSGSTRPFSGAHGFSAPPLTGQMAQAGSLPVSFLCRQAAQFQGPLGISGTP
mmetsp:Transcript_7821/g.18727  ORF Transcript_7821/g.18727 Transcript_7821/m.18727 type:complete len:214 (-) Transcript_7821:28-669(-)